MATEINNYNGTPLATVADGSLDTTSASIKFPGRGYVNYGEPVNENLLWIMQNFASGAPGPGNPVNGQTWYDTDTKLLKIYDSTTSAWITAGGVILAATAPVSGTGKGSFWYDTTKDQLHVWSGTAWLLVGPLGASDNLDPANPAVPAYSRIDAARLYDGSSYHQVWRVIVGGTVLAILSRDATFTPNPSISGFTTIAPGINFNSAIANVGISGDSTLFRNNQNNLPNTNNTYNMGSGSFRFATMYSTLFDGTATAARYADVAERYESDKEYSPGTVVCLGGEKEITATTKPGDDNVFGVVSTNPAHLMNSSAGNDVTHPAIALLGRVPCKVVGQVTKNQRLMASSVEGVACAWDQSFGPLAIIGRSLVTKSTHGIDSIEIVIGKN